MKKQDEYYLFREYQSGNFNIRIHRPILDDAERERRMKEIRRTAENLMREVVKKDALCP